jgi:hypothetical protein
MRRLWSLISAAGIFVLCVQAADAKKFNRACTSVPRHLRLSLQALETKVEAKGSRVQESRLTSTCAAFEAQH